MDWLQANLSNIIVISAVGAILYLCIRTLLNDKKKGKPSCACGGNCSSCAMCCHALDLRKIAGQRE
ncbi:MAG: FeoB-associated Cys-rich membrane protein [Erysipelotrichaceae bacterium]|nr:FeoB-associated Cys-rich membrane protein [Erysipelotrichaceae bacterium]